MLNERILNATEKGEHDQIHTSTQKLKNMEQVQRAEKQNDYIQ